MGRSPRRRRRSRCQRGDTLIEVLVTVAIMGTVIVTVLSLMTTLTVASTTQLQSVTAGNLATTVSERLDTISYSQCATTTSYAAALAPVDSRYTAQITGVRYLVSNAVDTAAFQNTCPSNPDMGVQEVSVLVYANGGKQGKARIVYLKRNSACPVSGVTLVPGQDC